MLTMTIMTTNSVKEKQHKAPPVTQIHFFGNLKNFIGKIGLTGHSRTIRDELSTKSCIFAS